MMVLVADEIESIRFICALRVQMARAMFSGCGAKALGHELLISDCRVLDRRDVLIE